MATNAFDPIRLGQKLKHLIKESNYKTQEQFAHAISVDPRTLRRWLQGDIDSISTLCCIADALDMDVMTILSDCFG